ncbi:TIGR03086 family metal-binding protein [Streptomyces sp. NPDC005483]|uniref:TIGR03086 family metal-binding protein n=1 Tax=Streptomyces sp. NPDC005483 TaxID=3154882 RepID=UPI00339ED6D3
MSAGELLERSLAYALGRVAAAQRVDLGRGTPCAQWNLGELLEHLDDSLDALYEGLSGGRIGLLPHADRVCGFRTRACAVLGAWAAGPPEGVLVGERPLDVRVMAAVGAVEITVHGWDVGRSCGRPRPIPDGLADELLSVARCVVGEEDRGARFAEPVSVPSSAHAGTRLLAFLGRPL